MSSPEARCAEPDLGVEQFVASRHAQANQAEDTCITWPEYHTAPHRFRRIRTGYTKGKVRRILFDPAARRAVGTCLYTNSKVSSVTV
jgi:hypothetical protein